ncbi:hypothetical protein V1525DRAFT_405216, partial [Lipomyces kononenkoae]
MESAEPYPAKDVIRLPLYSSYPCGQSWAKCCKQIAAWVYKEMKSNFALTGCWMARRTLISISMPSSGRTVVLKRIRVVRLLAFLADPTALHWAYLTEWSPLQFHSVLPLLRSRREKTRWASSILCKRSPTTRLSIRRCSIRFTSARRRQAARLRRGPRSLHREALRPVLWILPQLRLVPRRSL